MPPPSPTDAVGAHHVEMVRELRARVDPLLGAVAGGDASKTAKSDVMDTSAPPEVTGSPSVGRLRGVARLLGRSLQSLDAAGRSEEVMRLAAEGWLLLRDAAPDEAARLAGLLPSLLRRSVLESGEAPRSEAAGRLAAEAWLLLRNAGPVDAVRLAELLHRLPTPRTHQTAG